MERARCAAAIAPFHPTAPPPEPVLPVRGQQGAVLNEVSPFSPVTFCPLRLMGAAAVLSRGGRGETEDGEGERRERKSEEGGEVAALHNSVSRRGWLRGSWWIYVSPPLFNISIVFGQAPLYMCNYH